MQKLLRTLSAFYKKNKRDLPWRNTHDPYKILVSELMLQQTQVERVIPKYETFIKTFPDFKKLAKAPLSKVLMLWSGLGYNRRAKFLHEAAKMIHKKFGGTFPNTAAEAQSLPGVGPYTARAVLAFAFNKPEIFIETNIRTVFLYTSVLQKTRIRKVDDREILPLVEKALKASKMQPRDFYAALMDYGAYLKRAGVQINNKSKHYTKQSKFEGSYRQLRGAILRETLAKPTTVERLIDVTGRKKSDIVRILANLAKEGLIQIKNKKIRIAK